MECPKIAAPACSYVIGYVIVTSLVLTKLDYCNSVVAGLPMNLLNKLQACVLFEDGRTHHTVAERSSLAAHPRKDCIQTVCHGI